MKNVRLHTAIIYGTIALFTCLFSASQGIGQQKAHFTQYMYDASLINPAYVGADDALSLTLINRQQWSGVEGAPKSQTLSAHTLFKSNKLGVGAIIQHDKIGIHQNIQFSANAAYHLPLSRSQFLSFGMQVGIHNRNSNFGSLGFDPILGRAAASATYLDLGLGFYYRSPNFHIGFSMPDIVPNQMQMNEIYTSAIDDINHFLYAKYIIQASRNIELQPSILLKYMKGLPISYDLNLNATFKRVLTLGVSYRKGESVDFLTMFQLTAQLQFGYAYDYPIGNLTQFTNGSHEIMVRYLFKFKHNNIASPR